MFKVCCKTKTALNKLLAQSRKAFYRSGVQCTNQDITPPQLGGPNEF